jgi:hypothetical protein
LTDRDAAPRTRRDDYAENWKPKNIEGVSNAE